MLLARRSTALQDYCPQLRSEHDLPPCSVFIPSLSSVLFAEVFLSACLQADMTYHFDVPKLPVWQQAFLCQVTERVVTRRSPLSRQGAEPSPPSDPLGRRASSAEELGRGVHLSLGLLLEISLFCSLAELAGGRKILVSESEDRTGLPSHEDEESPGAEEGKRGCSSLFALLLLHLTLRPLSSRRFCQPAPFTR